MKTIHIILLIIWLLIGLITTWRVYWGDIKEWYIEFNEDYREWSKKNGVSALNVLLILSPIFIFGGLITFILFFSRPQTWYFKVPKDENGN